MIRKLIISFSFHIEQDMAIHADMSRFCSDSDSTKQVVTT